MSLRVALFIVLMIGFVDVIVALQYSDDEPNPWYVELAWEVLPLVAVTALFLLMLMAVRASRR